jgi:hypothetical protein
MRALLVLLAGGLLAAASGAPLAAQDWNDSTTLAFVEQATARRQATQADTSLRSYRTTAHGFLFFLGEAGRGEGARTQLVKADELKVQVYWQAPDRSKQVILGWRDGSWLPNDMRYHRDHLGIVTNNFGDRIRIGEGDEVRDVIHPLAPAGRAVYDYALDDSLSIRTAAGSLTVRSVRVRPKRFGEPAVVGTLYLDATTAELVRFRFSFTPASYRDRDLEDISIVLENSLWENRYWLPFRQEIEIRRKIPWFDFPVRGVIRGRWEIRDYDLEIDIPEQVFAGGDEIEGLRRPTPASATAGDTTWGAPLEAMVADVARPISEQEMAKLRTEVEQIVGARALGGLPARRLAAGSLSDIVRVNRVQGLTLGFGAAIGLPGTRVRLRPQAAYGTADERLTGSLALEADLGATRLTLGGGRRITDFSQWQTISPLLNSLMAQEGGRDHGDYVLLDRAWVGLSRPLGARGTLGGEVAVERSRSVATEASPARGEYEPNPPLGAGTYRLARLQYERGGAGLGLARGLEGALQLEGGTGPTDYLRATLEGRWEAPLGATTLRTRLLAGAGTDGLPAHRSFVLGGRGTLVGEPYRAYGGRQAALAHVEWRLPAPVPAIPLGSFASTGRSMTVAPFVAAGWTRSPALGFATDGIRPVAGLALEWPFGLLRVEAGVALRGGGFGITVDVNRDWWGLL